MTKVIGVLALILGLAAGVWVLTQKTANPGAPPARPSATPAKRPDATTSAPAPAPAPAPSTAGSNPLVPHGMPSAGTDCVQLNAVVQQSGPRCAGQPPRCLDDVLRQHGLDPRARDLCRLFRPGKQPLQ